MNLRRIGILLTTSAGLAMSQPAPPAFEVASVKSRPIPAGQAFFRFADASPILRAKGNRFTESVATLQDLIMDAYGVKDYQIIGMADWVKSPRGEHYDIDARSPGDAPPTPEQLQLMLQSLLADRFRLKLRRETRELPVYALVIGKSGPKLRELNEAETIAAITALRAKPAPSAVRIGTIASLAKQLSGVVDRPVLDETGLAGRYEYTLDWPQLGQERRELGASESVFGAIQDQLGLRLQPRKDRAEVLVIEHAEQPSAN